LSNLLPFASDCPFTSYFTDSLRTRVPGARAPVRADAVSAIIGRNPREFSHGLGPVPKPVPNTGSIRGQYGVRWQHQGRVLAAGAAAAQGPAWCACAAGPG